MKVFIITVLCTMPIVSFTQDIRKFRVQNIMLKLGDEDWTKLSPADELITLIGKRMTVYHAKETEQFDVYSISDVMPDKRTSDSTFVEYKFVNSKGLNGSFFIFSCKYVYLIGFHFPNYQCCYGVAELRD